MTTDTAKPARAPSEEAMAIARPLIGCAAVCATSGCTCRRIARALDAFAAHRLSTSLLNPSEEVVRAAARELIGMNYEPSHVCKERARAALRAAAMKITGRDG